MNFSPAKMAALLRYTLARIVILCAALALTGVLLVYTASLSNLRAQATSALQAVTVLFAVTTALSITLYSNHVKGLRDRSLQQIRVIRDQLEMFFDEFSGSTDENIQTIIDEFVFPLMNLRTSDWLDYEKVREMRDGHLEQALIGLHKRERTFLARHLLRIEDELNELGVMFIQRVCTTLHVGTIRGAFALTVVGMLSIAVAHLLPSGVTASEIVISIAAAVIVCAVMETLLLVSWFTQLGRDEIGEMNSDDDEGEIDATRAKPGGDTKRSGGDGSAP